MREISNGEMEADGLYRCRQTIGAEINDRINSFPPNVIWARAAGRVESIYRTYTCKQKVGILTPWGWLHGMIMIKTNWAIFRVESLAPGVHASLHDTTKGNSVQRRDWRG